MIPSEMQMEAFEGERQLIHLFVPKKKKKETAVQPLLAGLFHVHCAMGPRFISAVLPPPDLAAPSKAQETSGQT